jgi:small subunit ribosomal protein S8
MMTDPIADMLARVRNAALAQHASTRIPASKLKHNIAKILKEAGYIADVRLDESPITKRPEIIVALKNDRDRPPRIRAS